jgi:hypothetical protein
VTVKYQDGDKIKQASATAKDLLNELGLNTGKVKLCLGEDLHVYVVNKGNGTVVDISGDSDYGMWVDASQQLYTQKVSGNSDQNVSYQSEGQVHVEFYSTNSVFILNGLYTAKASAKYNDKKDTTKLNDSAKTMDVSGTAEYVADLGENLPASGTISGNGNGTVDGGISL